MQLEPLSDEDVVAVLKRALADTRKGLGQLQILASDDILNLIASYADCDARIGLNLLEQICM